MKYELEITEEEEELHEETAARVAAGAARKVLGNKTKIRGALIQIGKKKIIEITGIGNR